MEGKRTEIQLKNWKSWKYEWEDKVMKVKIKQQLKGYGKSVWHHR